MKHAISNIVYASLMFTISAVNIASAASVSGGYSLSAFNPACSASGQQGGGSINETTAGCSNYINSGTFQASGLGVATYDSLRASSSVGLTALDPGVFTTSGQSMGTATGLARYSDSLIIDIAGRTGEIVDLIFETAMSGTVNTSGSSNIAAEATSRLSVFVNGSQATMSRAVNYSGDFISDGTNPGRIQIQLGTAFNVSAELSTRARLLATNVSGQFEAFSGGAVADFGNTAGITSFTLLETGTDSVLIPDWSLTSESGEFGFYSAVVPIPASVWLFVSSLGLLSPWLRRKRNV